MKSYLHSIDQCLWFANAISYWIVLTIGKSLRSVLPRFWIYILFSGIEGVALIAIGFLSYPTYFWSFYAGLAIESVLLIVVLYEIFLESFAPLDTLPARTIPRLVAMVASAAALVLAWAMWKPASHVGFPWFVDFLSTLNRSAGAVTAAALWTVVMYARHLRIPWRSRAAGVARGFLVYLSAQAILTAVSGFSTVRGTMIVNRLAMICYLAALAMWMRAVTRKEIPVILPAPESLKTVQTAVAGMKTAMARVRTQVKVPQAHSTE